MYKEHTRAFEVTNINPFHFNLYKHATQHHHHSATFSFNIGKFKFLGKRKNERKLMGTAGTVLLLKGNLVGFLIGGGDPADSVGSPAEVTVGTAIAEETESPGKRTCLSRFTAQWRRSSRKDKPSKNKTTSFSL